MKVDSGAFDAFHSPNLPPLAELEIKIKGTGIVSGSLMVVLPF